MLTVTKEQRAQADALGIRGFLKPYGPLIEAVLSGTVTTEHGVSNAQMADRVCALLRLEKLELFNEFDMEKAFESGDMPSKLAGAFICYLRQQVFRMALDQDIGTVNFNTMLSAYHELWHQKLLEQWQANRTGADPAFHWIN